MGAIGEAQGKLLLFGEHAAVYGHPAVGVALPERTTVRLDDSDSPGWNLDRVPAEDRGTVSNLLARMEPSGKNQAVRIESTIPRSLGFGSSAALCVAFARALVQNGSEDRVWTLAHDAEHLFHGRPSGVDTGISMLGGLCVLKPSEGRLPGHAAVTPVGACLVVGAVRRDDSCAALIGGLARRMKAGDPPVVHGIETLGEIASLAARLLQSPGRDTARYLGALADAAMATLRVLGLSTPDLELVLGAARSAGARGAKLSGAGGGGAFYAVAPDEEAADVIARKIKETGVPLPGPVRVVGI